MDFVKELMGMLEENGHHFTDKMEVLELVEKAYRIDQILKKQPTK